MKASANGRDFRLVLSPLPANRLPKRCPTVTVKVDGVETLARVTTNRGWSVATDKTLDYIWIEVAGKAYYLTLDYAETAESMKGAEFTVSDGTAARVDPARIGKADKEQARIAAFKTTWALRAGPVKPA